ncbi:hypothetical protein LUZ62_043281 [Rhynchospora pubera]|uniref:Uncharacterized protein n=1 Tax=Rhynchospora pubera TaxID=906938 RepID=A0AAV8FEV0_9POAL|nr:hypothetical protein LUZ62_043281 [Rhynchospora pubera]
MARSPSSSFLRQPLHLLSKNPKLFYSVYLIYILCHVLLYVGFLLCITPLVSKLIELTKAKHAIIDVSSPEFTKLVDTIQAVLNELLIIQTIYYVLLFVISWFLSIINYYANSATYLGEMLTLKDVLNKVKGIIKGPLITNLFVILSTLVYIISFAVGNAILTMKLASHDSVAANWALAFVYQILLQVLNWYSTIAITVLYYECNRNGDELEYTKLATTGVA